MKNLWRSISRSIRVSLVGALAGCAGSASPLVSPAEKALEVGPPGGGKGWEEAERVVAEVNGRPITQGDFYRRVLRQFGTAKLLSGILAQEVVFQEAERRGLQVTPEEVDRKVDEILREEEREAGGRENLARSYAEVGLTLEDVRRDHASEAEGQLLLSKVVKSMRKLDDAMLREYYQASYAGTRHMTRHIAFGFAPRPGGGEPAGSDEELNRLKLEAFGKAARAADRVRKGADFSELARVESEDTVTAPRGGDLGPIGEGSPMDPLLKRAILALGAGEVSEPVENPGKGYHVFQVTAVLPGESFADCKEKMVKEILEAEPGIEEVRGVLMALQRSARVNRFDSALAPDSPAGEARPGGK